MAAYPGPWAFSVPKQAIIFVSDAELEALAADPDKILDLSLDAAAQVPGQPASGVRGGKKQGARTLIVAFDHFFQQYRPGQDHARRLMPDMDAYIEKIARIGKFAEQYGLGLELSLLTPLEIGRAYRQATGESGVWMQYRKGLRDPEGGAFSVELWRHRRWVNNKGPFDLEDAGVRVFAFREQSAAGHAVPRCPRGVHHRDHRQGQSRGAGGHSGRAVSGGTDPRARHGQDRPSPGSIACWSSRCYRTPEMDYFSDKALPYLKGLVDRYATAGVKLNGLYSDEPHLMGDWSYHWHHDHGQFAMRYVSPGLRGEVRPAVRRKVSRLRQVPGLLHLRSGGLCHRPSRHAGSDARVRALAARHPANGVVPRPLLPFLAGWRWQTSSSSEALR